MIHESPVQNGSIKKYECLKEFEHMSISNILNLNKININNQCKIGIGTVKMLNLSTSRVSKFNISVSNEIENTYNNSPKKAIRFVEKINTSKNHEIIFKNDVSISYYPTKLYNGKFLKDRNQIMARKVKQKKVTITREVAQSTSINGITEKTT